MACKVFLDDGRLWGDMNEAYREFVTADDPPARAAVRGGLMNPDFLVEIQCVAEQSDERRVVRRAGQQPGSSPLSPAIATGERVWLSGMLAPGDDAEGEARAHSGQPGCDPRGRGAGVRGRGGRVGLPDRVRDAEAVLGAIAEVLPDGAPVPTVAGLPLVGRLGVEIQMTAVVP